MYKMRMGEAQETSIFSIIQLPHDLTKIWYRMLYSIRQNIGTVLTCNHDLYDKPLHILYNNKVIPVIHKFDTQRYPTMKSSRLEVFF